MNSVFAVASTDGRAAVQSGALRIRPTPSTSTSSGVGIQRAVRPSTLAIAWRLVAKLAVSAAPTPTASREWTGRPVRSSIRVSSVQARRAATMTSAWNIHAGALTVSQTNAGTRTTALAARRQITGTPPAPSRIVPSATSTLPTSHPAKAPRPFLELGHGQVEVARAEVRPEHGRDQKLRVRDLPQEEVRDPHLAAGADQEIGVGDVRGVEGAAHVLLGDVLGLQVAGLDLTRQRAERVQQLVPAAVVEGHQHGQPRVVPGLVHHVVDAAANTQGDPARLAEDAEPGVAGHELGELGVDRALEQVHQHRDLIQRPAPVLRREGVEREEPEPDRVGRAHDAALRLDALAVTGDPRQAAAAPPPSVAVPDDGDVLRNALGADCCQQRRLTVARSHATVISRNARMTKSPAPSS